jgi:hypothetical protein
VEALFLEDLFSPFPDLSSEFSITTNTTRFLLMGDGYKVLSFDFLVNDVGMSRAVDLSMSVG